MKAMRLMFVSAMILCLGLTMGVRGDVIALWDFEDRVTATDVETGLNASTMTVSSGSISFQNGTDDGGSRIGNSGSWSTNAVFSAGGKYMAFSVTTVTGYEMELDEVTVRLGRTGTGPEEFVAQYSLDGFATDGVEAGSGTIVSENANALDAFTLTAPTGTLTGTVTYRVWGFDASGTGNLRFNNFRVWGDVSVVAGEPLVLLNPDDIDGLNYPEDDGPSTPQSYEIEGFNLEGSGNITVTAPANFEVSTSSESGFGPTANLPFSGGEITDQPVTVYVRLAAGLDQGLYSGDITHSGGGLAAGFDVSVSGDVYEPFVIPYENEFKTIEDSALAELQGFDLSGTIQETGAGGYLRIFPASNFTTPIIDFTAFDGLKLEMDLTTYGGALGQKLTIQVSTNGGAYVPLTTIDVPGAYETFSVIVDLRDELNVENGHFRFFMSDGGGSIRFRDFSIDVADPLEDEPPIITLNPPGDDKVVYQGNLISFDVIADQIPADAEEHTELYATELPGNASFPGATGDAPVQATFDWTPNEGGVYTAVFEAADKDGVATQAVTITVREVPEHALVYYTFTDDATDPVIVAAGVDASTFGISAGSVGFGWFAGAVGDWEALGGDEPYAQGSGGWAQDDQETAKHFIIELTSEPGEAMTITNISFLHRRTAAGPDTAGVSIDGASIFVDDLPEVTVVPVSIPVTGYVDITNAVIRFAGWGDTTGGGLYQIDNVLVQGVVGEPGLRISVDQPDGFKVEQGTVEMITATAEDGEPPYEYDWESDLNDSHWDADDNVFTILATAPAGDYYAKVTVEDAELEEADTTVNFSVAPKYPIVITPPANGSVDTDPEDSAFEDDTVTIIADPDPGFAVDEITVTGDDTTDITVTDNTFTMPAQGVTVEVTFEEIPAPPGLLAQFLADAEDESVPVQPPAFLAANLSLVDGGMAGTGEANVLAKEPTTAWVDEYHYAHVAGTGAYQGERADNGFVLIINAAEGYTFNVSSVSFRHRATSTGPGMVGIKINDVNYSGSNDEVSTTVTTYESEALGLTGLTQAVVYVQGWDSPGTGNGEFQMNDLQILGSVESDDPPDPDPDEPEFESFVVAAGQPAQTFIENSAAGSTYILEYTTDLSADPQVWTEADSQPGTGGALMLEDDDPPGVIRIYRIRVTTP